jgi:hypothetical protein
MKTTDLPIFHQLLIAPTDQRWERPYTPVAIERLNGALTQWANARVAGEIENARFIESKDVISRAVEDAWKRVSRDSAWVNSLPDAQRDALDTNPYPNLSNLDGRLKRVLKTPPHPTRDNLEAFITDIKPVIDFYAFLKANAKKRVPRSAEEIEATRFVPPTSSSTAVAQVKALLETMVDRDFTYLLNHCKSINRAMIENFVTAQKKANAANEAASKTSTGYSPSHHFTVNEGRFKGRVTSPESVTLLNKVLHRHYDDKRHFYTYLVDKDTWGKSDDAALKVAQFIRDQFVFKNLKKLTSILEIKGEENFDAVTEKNDSLNLTRMQGEFHFTFKDGASFDVHNALVFVTNQFSTSFVRYPLTFHAVVLPNGESMKMPSEKSMNDTFAVARAEPSSDPVTRRRRQNHP